MADDRKPVALTAKQRTAAAIASACLIAAPITASFEGERLHPYHDPAPKHTLTVCDGETRVVMKAYTHAECQAMLVAHQRQDYAPAVLRCTPGVAPKPDLFAAAIDAAYNAGSGSYCRSPVAAAFNRGRWAAGCKAYLGWHTLPGTKAHNGLVRRREAEYSLCMKDAL